MDYRILGPLEVWDDGQRILFSGGRRRMLLAALLLHANEALSRDRLVEALWPGRPPESADKIVQNHVSALRKVLPPEALETCGQGYRLAVVEGELDLERFRAGLDEGKRLLAAGAAVEAANLLRETLLLWRGAPLADCNLDGEFRAECLALAELHASAIEQRIDADLATGRHAEVIGELETYVSAYPYNERFTDQLMLALYRSGRQADALAVYRGTRMRFARELAIEPSASLQQLEHRILNHDPTLDLQLPGSVRRLRQRWSVLLATGVVLVAAAASAAVVEVTRGAGGGLGRVAPNSLAAIDPRTNRVVAEIPVGIRPAGVAAGEGSLWVANLDDRTVARVDPASDTVLRTISVGDAPAEIASGAGAVWTLGTAPRTSRAIVRRIDPRFDDVSDRVTVPATWSESAAMAATPRDVWIASSLGELARLDPASGRIASRIDLNDSPAGMAADAGALWVTDALADTVTRVDPTGALTTVPVGRGPTGIAVGAGAVWVIDSLDDALVRIDPSTRAVTTTIPVGRGPTAVATAYGAVWVANGDDGTVSRIDPRTDRVDRTIRLGGRPSGIDLANGRIWVTVQASLFGGSGNANTGGIAHVVAQSSLDSIDPALAYTAGSWQVEYATCAKLLNYPDRRAPLGSRLVPEVAQALPTISSDGKTLTFTIRRNFRFSPPSGERVTAQTFKYSIERSLDPRMNSAARTLMRDIVGEPAYAAGKARHIAGVVAHSNTLTIRLSRPSGDLPARLAMPFFCAVPLGTPVDPNGVESIPSAGPYYVASYEPAQGLVLKRNPDYGGSRPRPLSEIDLKVGVSKARAVKLVETGAADYAFDGVPPEDDAGLARRYGASSAAAQGGHQRYFADPTLSVFFLAMNTQRSLFSSPAMRKAVNYAIDRRALARFGLSDAPYPARPTDQYLPPGVPGFRDFHVYPLTPDLGKARALAAGRLSRAVLYTSNLAPAQQRARLLARELHAIGIELDVKTFALPVLFAKIARRGEPFDLALTAWAADFPDPADFLGVLSGSSIRQTDSTDPAFFDDPTYNRRLAAAARLTGERRYRAYERLDLELMRDAAPWAAIANPTTREFFSARMGCEINQPTYGIDLTALCIRRR